MDDAILVIVNTFLSWFFSLLEISVREKINYENERMNENSYANSLEAFSFLLLKFLHFVFPLLLVLHLHERTRKTEFPVYFHIIPFSFTV